MTTTHHRLIAAAAIATLLYPGCVKREEKITVTKKGALKWKIEVSGDRQDMENGAPALAQAPGWEFEQRIVTEQDGKQEIHREAAVTIEPGRSIPSTYPTDDPEGEALAMVHPTTLEIERRVDGVYYHFRRAYEPRPSAFVDVWWNKFYEDYHDEDPEEMSDEEALKFVRRLAEISIHQHHGLIRAATLRLSEPLPQDLLLQLYRIVTDRVTSVDAADVVAMLREDASSDEGGGELDEIAERIQKEIDVAAIDALRHAGLPRWRVDEFARSLARERRRYAITEDYQDEQWQIKLSMPGEIVGHNGDQIDDEGRIVWKRDGEHFSDRVVELLATSRVTE